MKLLANPYVLGAIVIALALSHLSSYRLGHRHAENACAAEKAEALQRAIDQAAEVARQDAEVLTAHEGRKERLRNAFQSIHEGVTRYVQNHAGAADRECLDPDGLRLWRAANAAEAAAPQPDYAVPGSAAATLGTRGGLAGQPRAGGGDLSRVPGTAPGAIGVGQE